MSPTNPRRRIAAILKNDKLLYFSNRLINLEWDHRISATVKERPADSIRIDEVDPALKQIRHKATGLSGLVAEMIQSTGILELSGYWIYTVEL